MDATITAEMVIQKQSEINLIRKIFEEILKCVGNESSVFDPKADNIEFQPLGTSFLMQRTHYFVASCDLFQNDNSGL